MRWCCTLAALAALAAAAPAADWPQWLGPNRDGSSPDKTNEATKNITRGVILREWLVLRECEKKWGTRFGRGLAYPASLVPVFGEN